MTLRKQRISMCQESHTHTHTLSSLKKIARSRVPLESTSKN